MATSPRHGQPTTNTAGKPAGQTPCTVLEPHRGRDLSAISDGAPRPAGRAIGPLWPAWFRAGTSARRGPQTWREYAPTALRPELPNLGLRRVEVEDDLRRYCIMGTTEDMHCPLWGRILILTTARPGLVGQLAVGGPAFSGQLNWCYFMLRAAGSGTR